MAKWWPFGRKKKEEEAPRPGGGGLLGRLFGRGRKKEEEAPEAPPAPPEAPAAPPEEAAPAPEAAEAPAEGETPAEGEAPAEGAPPAEPPKPRVYPPFLHVDADGSWVISSTMWEGTMSGTLHGRDVKTFIDAMERDGGPDYDTAIPLIADAYGIPGGLVQVGQSAVYSVSY